jgi:hypothetical protein
MTEIRTSWLWLLFLFSWFFICKQLYFFLYEVFIREHLVCNFLGQLRERPRSTELRNVIAHGAALGDRINFYFDVARAMLWNARILSKLATR